MTDRELLELAAKAVGYGLPGPDDHDEIGRQELDGLWVKFPWGWGWWRPLFSDADALRLAAKLQLNIKFHYGLVLVGKQKLLADEASEDYKYAIVRAAAEIGKAMK